jgi:DNA-binding NarL/FixJ family response regulator
MLPFSPPNDRVEPDALRGKQAHFSAQENEVLDLLSKGLSYGEIAEQVGISDGSVQDHVARIYKTLHLHSLGITAAKVFERTTRLPP